jgi:hypothetical protein
MLVMKADDLKKKGLPDEGGESAASGSSPDVESDDDVDEMYEKFFGNKPKGKTLAEEVEGDEQARRTPDIAIILG